MKIDNHKSKTELIAEIQKLRQALDQSTPNVNNLMRQCDDLTLINDLNAAVIQQKPLNYLLSLLSRSVSAIFNSHGVAVYLLSRDNNLLEMQPNTLPPKISDLIERLLSVKIPEVVIKRSSDSYYFKALTSGAPLTINGANNVNKLIYEFTDSKIIRKHAPKIQKVIGIKNVLIFPLVFGDTALGVMDISRKTAFVDSEVRRLRQIVSQVTEAILYHKAILEKESLLQELQETYNKLKKLSGLIPICAHCKKIRDDSGYWNQVEKYISEHSDAVFSHGICPDCMKQYYPEFVAKKNLP
ncbi:GAF domain-containing protein [bacterium]|nr:GAF domain-containing protein [bacterium]MBU1065298.1 GAF domain-containing protein [bacterium]MBU1635611.1 GAF domain-containing protein [bacterium]MBU1875468.1 GAF domain-containing protein [bacterium]